MNQFPHQMTGSVDFLFNEPMIIPSFLYTYDNMEYGLRAPEKYYYGWTGRIARDGRILPS
ncbi:hypothetical protein [Peribacillus sp. SCS-155]|uniref:hypothetical protein n=1 Tax=Peribacillus sedimenti TaxID=3115297 RepID=UPI0039064498